MKYIPLTVCALLLALSFVPGGQSRTGEVSLKLKGASREDRRELSAFYGALADITKRDGGEEIKDTPSWRLMNKKALHLAFTKKPIVGKYPGLDKAIDSQLLEGIGLEPLPLNKELESGLTVADKLHDNCLAVKVQCE